MNHSESKSNYGSANVIFAAIIGAGVCLFGVVIGLTLIGFTKPEDIGQDAITALATIGGSLAGGFGGWIARGLIIPNQNEEDKIE